MHVKASLHSSQGDAKMSFQRASGGHLLVECDSNKMKVIKLDRFPRVNSTEFGIREVKVLKVGKRANEVRDGGVVKVVHAQIQVL